MYLFGLGGKRMALFAAIAERKLLIDSAEITYYVMKLWFVFDSNCI